MRLIWLSPKVARSWGCPKQPAPATRVAFWTVLRETLPSGVYETRLYRYDGVIMAEYALADAPYDPSKATAIVRSSVFDFSYGGGLLTIVTDAGQTSVALRAAGGDA